jgi:aminomethyltransferase
VFRTSLYERHVAAGARMIPFAGWDMPVQYAGIIEEHLHTRSRASLFDTSHMGEFRLSGHRAFADVDRLFTGRLDNLAIGRCRYGFLLNPEGGIVDDIMVFRVSDTELFLVVNAATTLKDRAWITQAISDDTTFRDESGDTAMIALQGPLAPAVLAGHMAETAALKRFGFGRGAIAGVPCLVSRTGYTGEDGFEIFVRWTEAPRVWDRLLEHPDVRPAGLGARDTLRLEKGYSLYGNDIDDGTSPREADLMRFVHMDKEFAGRPALLARGEPARLLIGFVCAGRRIPRAHWQVRVDGRQAGQVTSGGFSPVLQQGVGLAYVEAAAAAEGREVVVTDGKTEIQARLKKPPMT